MNTDCGNWAVSASWSIPDEQITGVYFARVVRHDGERSWRADNSQKHGSPKFSYPDDKGKIPKEPQPGAHAYGASGNGQLEIALYEPQASHIYFLVRNVEGTKADMLF